jgi:hypothetical protein
MTDGQGREPEDFESPDWYARETIRRAKDGDTVAALELMHTAMCGLWARSMNPHVSDYLADCLMGAHKALSDKDGRPGDALAKAFNFKKEPRRPNDAKKTERDSNIAVWVQMAQDECGMTAAEAKAAAGVLFSIENIDRVLRDAGGVQNYNSDYFRKLFRKINRPLPTRR